MGRGERNGDGWNEKQQNGWPRTQPIPESASRLMPAITSDAEVLIRLVGVILCNFLSEESSRWSRSTPMGQVMHILNNGVLDGVKARGNYEEVYNDPDVTVVYVGTPHVLHHRNTKDALLAGKHVLLEKPACLEVEELDELIKIAKEKNLFFMEAVWTRFQPIAYAIEKVIKSGILGKPRRFSADFSMDWDLDASPDSSRMVNPALGGGSLLDMSAYPSVWAMLLVHRHPLNTDKDPKVLFTHQTIYPRSGVDINSRWIQPRFCSVTKGIWLLPTRLTNPRHSTSIHVPLASPNGFAT
ncbi:uncharacterized protein IAS62_004208 [Cryptococcus decagattii]|uniref:D-xylose 1-dehydrogenase (NADP(+), D-xylono-1,5-lactone-forming) n=1 Tax=Cryptococcus decagattii TaxID=1859122 RepID=A0ABZ2AWD1_9TREE